MAGVRQRDLHRDRPHRRPWSAVGSNTRRSCSGSVSIEGEGGDRIEGREGAGVTAPVSTMTPEEIAQWEQLAQEGALFGIAPPPKPPKPPREVKPCGTRAAYARGCRCDPCQEAMREYNRRKYLARLAKGPSRLVHGTAGGYRSYGCRCEDCTAASTIAHRAYMRHRASP